MTPGQQREIIGRALHCFAANVLDLAEEVERYGLGSSSLRAEARDALEVEKHLGEILKEKITT